MIKINLLPAEAAQKEIKKRIFLLAGAAGAGLFCLMIIFFFIRLSYERSLNNRLNYLQGELKKYQEIVDEVNRLRSNAAVLEQKKKLIEGLMENRIAYPKFMEKFLQVLPPSLWITSLNTVSDASGLNLTIGCIAFDNFGIADFITNLENSGKFKGAELGSIATNRKENYELLSFQITCRYFFAGE